MNNGACISCIWVPSGNRCSSNFKEVSTIYINQSKDYFVTGELGGAEGKGFGEQEQKMCAAGKRKGAQLVD